MADKRISQLVDRGTVVNSDVVPIVVSGAVTTNKATISSIQTFMQGNLDLGVTSVGITLGSSGTDVSVSGSPVTSSGNITINLPTASATNRGLLSSANWTTFNSKVSSVGLSMPSAFTVANSPITGSGTIAVTGAGTVSQYVRGDGSLADFPQGGGGGGSVSYYLNSSVSQGTIGGIAYKEMNKVPILGAGTDLTIAADGYIASYITDAGDPALLEIPAGNWNFETFFSASSGGGSPSFYVELYKVNSGGTATLIASNSATPELIAFGTVINPYFSSLAVPTTVLTITDRLALRYYVTHSGRTITLHTENSHLCQIITTFTTGLTALNGLTAQVQNFATGTSGTDFAISSATNIHTFNLPDASATARGVVTTGTQTFAGAKTLTSPLNGTTSIFSSSFATNETSKIGIGFESGYGLINAWGSDASTYAGLKFQVSESDGNTYDALRINPDGTLYAPAGGYISILQAASFRVGTANAQSQVLTPPVAKFINSANNFVKIALGQGETSPNFNDYYGIIALDNNVDLADNKLRFYLGYDDAANSHSNDQLVIQGDGNVGIGTATPSAKLHVMGTATLTGALNGTSATFTGTALLGGASATNPLSIRTANGESYLRFLNADGTTYGDLERSITGAGAVRFTGANFRFTGGAEVVGTLTGAAATFSGDVIVSKAGAVGSVIDLGSATAGAYGVIITRGNGNTAGNTQGIWAVINKQSGTDVQTAAIEFAHEGSSADNKTYGAFFTHNGTSLGERMRITSGGKVLIGTDTSGAGNLIVSDNNNSGLTLRRGSTADRFLFFVGASSPYITDDAYIESSNADIHIRAGSTGGVKLAIGATSFVSDSDIRLKDKIGDIDNALDSILKLETLKFNWKYDSELETKRAYFGLVAQNVQELLPELVEIGRDEMQTLGIKYTELIPVLVKAIQEQQAQIDSLKNQIK
jgi:hypothetical protein